ncbi:uncharacterized protein LOC123298469 [Chrysoperla carnea]|uniref:uncharacterized protein LOC123298469 n=1 Tax=Chrysoperla carnea TaxID=189513 RepID=UPI001D06DCCC|nr:uncharacterized protein LOC123298469 [Chrysoperla carnea]
MVVFVKHSNTQHKKAINSLLTILTIAILLVPHTVLTSPIMLQQLSNNIDTMLTEAQQLTSNNNDNNNSNNDEVPWLFIPCGNSIMETKKPNPLSTMNRAVQCRKQKVSMADIERIILMAHQAIVKIQQVIHSKIFDLQARDMLTAALKGSRCNVHKKAELLKAFRKRQKNRKINLTEQLPKIHRELQNLTYIFYRLQQIRVLTSIEDPNLNNRTEMIKQTKHVINVLLCEVEQTINNSCSDHLIHRVTLQELQEINEQQIPQTISSTDLQIEDLKYLYQTEEALCEHLELMQFVKHKRENKQHRNHKDGIMYD